MNFELYERRVKCLRYHLQGVPTRTWIAEVAGESDITERALWIDWNKRDEWLPVIYQITESAEDISKATGEMISNLREASKEFYRLYRNANSDSGKVNSLKGVLDSVKLELELRQDMGLMPKIAQERSERVGSDEAVLRELLREHRESIQVEATALEHLHTDDLPKSLDPKVKHQR